MSPVHRGASQIGVVDGRVREPGHRPEDRCAVRRRDPGVRRDGRRRHLRPGPAHRPGGAGPRAGVRERPAAPPRHPRVGAEGRRVPRARRGRRRRDHRGPARRPGLRHRDPRPARRDHAARGHPRRPGGDQARRGRVQRVHRRVRPRRGEGPARGDGPRAGDRRPQPRPRRQDRRAAGQDRRADRRRAGRDGRHPYRDPLDHDRGDRRRHRAVPGHRAADRQGGRAAGPPGPRGPGRARPRRPHPVRRRGRQGRDRSDGGLPRRGHGQHPYLHLRGLQQLRRPRQRLPGAVEGQRRDLRRGHLDQRADGRRVRLVE